LREYMLWYIVDEVDAYKAVTRGDVGIKEVCTGV
jgi:hypothetical protein